MATVEVSQCLVAEWMLRMLSLFLREAQTVAGIVGQIHKCLQGNSREEGYSSRIDPSPTRNSSEMQEPGGCSLAQLKWEHSCWI